MEFSGGFSVHGNVKRTDVNSGNGQTSASVYAIMRPQALAVCFRHAGPCVTGGPYISSPPPASEPPGSLASEMSEGSRFADVAVDAALLAGSGVFRTAGRPG